MKKNIINTNFKKLILDKSKKTEEKLKDFLQLKKEHPEEFTNLDNLHFFLDIMCSLDFYTTSKNHKFILKNKSKLSRVEKDEIHDFLTFNSEEIELIKQGYIQKSIIGLFKSTIKENLFHSQKDKNNTPLIFKIFYLKKFNHISKKIIKENIKNPDFIRKINSLNSVKKNNPYLITPLSFLNSLFSLNNDIYIFLLKISPKLKLTDSNNNNPLFSNYSINYFENLPENKLKEYINSKNKDGDDFLDCIIKTRKFYFNNKQLEKFKKLKNHINDIQKIKIDSIILDTIINSNNIKDTEILELTKNINWKSFVKIPGDIIVSLSKKINTIKSLTPITPIEIIETKKTKQEKIDFLLNNIGIHNLLAEDMFKYFVENDILIEKGNFLVNQKEILNYIEEEKNQNQTALYLLFQNNIVVENLTLKDRKNIFSCYINTLINSNIDFFDKNFNFQEQANNIFSTITPNNYKITDEDLIKIAHNTLEKHTESYFFPINKEILLEKEEKFLHDILKVINNKKIFTFVENTILKKMKNTIITPQQKKRL